MGVRGCPRWTWDARGGREGLLGQGFPAVREVHMLRGYIGRFFRLPYNTADMAFKKA